MHAAILKSNKKKPNKNKFGMKWSIYKYVQQGLALEHSHSFIAIKKIDLCTETIYFHNCVQVEFCLFSLRSEQ